MNFDTTYCERKVECRCCCFLNKIEKSENTLGEFSWLMWLLGTFDILTQKRHLVVNKLSMRTHQKSFFFLQNQTITQANHQLNIQARLVYVSTRAALCFRGVNRLGGSLILACLACKACGLSPWRFVYRSYETYSTPPIDALANSFKAGKIVLACCFLAVATSVADVPGENADGPRRRAESELWPYTMNRFTNSTKVLCA